MMRKGLRFMCTLCCGMGMALVQAIPPAFASVTKTEDKPLPHVFNWVFSGMVLNDRGERYGYYFEARRHEQQFQVYSALVNIEKKSLVFVDENEAILPDNLSMNWQIGRAYLGFNAVTNRWVLGVTADNQRGFNFKIDALQSDEQQSHAKMLRTGLAMSVQPMGRLNGHVYLGSDEEEFVTAKNTWLREFMTKKSTATFHPLTNVLCHFNDGSGFYAVHLLDPDAFQGFVAGWHNSTGIPVRMSQFVSVRHSSPQEWDLSASFPSFHIHFSNLLNKSFQRSDIGAGVVDGKMSGFCTAERAMPTVMLAASAVKIQPGSHPSAH